MSAGYFPKREKVGLEDLFRGLVTATHILHYEDILDVYGHISVRSPDNAATFWMPRSMPSALVSTQDDLIEYKVDDAGPLEKNAKLGHIERHIHSEIYKRFPAVNSVVFSGSSEVLPYCVSDVPLKATIPLASFMGNNVPAWDASSHYPSGSKHDLLIRTSTLGASLSAAFKPATSAGFIYSKVRSALPTQLAGNPPDPSREPDHAVVLLQGRGFVNVAHGIEEAVFQAIYTKKAAQVQTTAMTIRNAHFGHVVEGKVDVEGGGKIKSAKVKAEGDLKYLKDGELHDAWEAVRETIPQSWELWRRRIEINPLYKNECPKGED